MQRKEKDTGNLEGTQDIGNERTLVGIIDDVGIIELK